MNYDELVEFIEEKMRMSHIYQPVMLITLLSRGGKMATWLNSVRL
jgi:ATP adenylyltransferase